MYSLETSERVQDFSKELLREFLSLKQQGYCLPDSVILVGGPKRVRDQVAREVARQIGGKITVRTDARPHGDKNVYSIDVGYFLNH